MTYSLEEIKALRAGVTSGPRYATAVNLGYELPSDDDEIWTVSSDPETTGWINDSNQDGYGLKKKEAEFYAASSAIVDQLVEENEIKEAQIQMLQNSILVQTCTQPWIEIERLKRELAEAKKVKRMFSPLHTYAFVTWEEIEKAESYCFRLMKSMTGIPVAVKEFSILAVRLLTERDQETKRAERFKGLVMELEEFLIELQEMGLLPMACAREGGEEYRDALKRLVAKAREMLAEKKREGGSERKVRSRTEG